MEKIKRVITILIIMMCILFLGITKNYAVNSKKNVTSTNNLINEETIVEEKEGLSDLTIEDVTLSPEFSSKQYSYTAKYIGEKTSLKIEATPADENYIIEITGNEELEEGENIVTILVSESDGSNVATYQIIINKSLVDYEEIAKQEAQKEQRKKIIIGAIIAIIILIIIISIVIKKKRNDDYFDDEDDEDEDYDYEDEMPRALRNNNKNYNYEEENFEEMSKEEIRKKYLSNYENEEDQISEKIEKNEEENFEDMSKDEIKMKFLDEYANYEEHHKIKSDEPKRKKHHKGKRFK